MSEKDKEKIIKIVTNEPKLNGAIDKGTIKKIKLDLKKKAFRVTLLFFICKKFNTFNL